MNTVILIGNLTKDPEIRTTAQGKKVAAFSLAINEGKNQNGENIVSYFNLSAWDKKAEILELYVKKGHKVAVTGRLSINTWTRQDGTKASTPEIIVQSLELLTSRFEADRIGSSMPSTPSPSRQNSSSHQNNITSDSPAHPEETHDTSSVPDIDINDIDFNVQMPF